MYHKHNLTPVSQASKRSLTLLLMLSNTEVIGCVSLILHENIVSVMRVRSTEYCVILMCWVAALQSLITFTVQCWCTVLSNSESLPAQRDGKFTIS